MLRRPHLLALVATLLATAAAASAQMTSSTPTITAISATNLQLTQVPTFTMMGNTNMTAYMGTGSVTIGANTYPDMTVTVVLQKVVNPDGIGVENGAITMYSRTSGQMLSGRLLAAITASQPDPTIVVDGAQRMRSMTMSTTRPQMLRANLTVAPGATSTSVSATLDGVLETMPAMGFGTMTRAGG